MKFIKKIIQITLITILMVLIGCEDPSHDPIGNDGITPGKVLNTQIENFKGGAVIRYEIPPDEDLLYIEAQYKLKNGIGYKVRSSVYSDSLKVEGFSDTDKYQVNLFSVDRGENRSEPVSVEVEPLVPPLVTIFESLDIVSAFGGVNVTWENMTNAEVVITVLASDKKGIESPQEVAGTFYTKSSIGKNSIRGFDAIDYKFSAFVKDKWGNVSDIISKIVLPLYEIELDKNLFAEVILPGDVLEDGGGMKHIWDGDVLDRSRFAVGNMPDNYYFTFDLGTTAKLSRFTFWQFLNYSNYYIYADAQFRKFEVWGAETLDDSGSWDSWTKLRDCEIVKPSGLPKGIGNYNNEDKELAFKGHEFEFKLTDPKVRYIRIKVNESFSGIGWGSLGEMTFFGETY